MAATRWAGPARSCSRSSSAGWLCSRSFCVIETRVAEPMFRLALFRIRPFTAGNLASLLAALGRAV